MSDKYNSLIEEIDPSIFQVESQTSDADKRSLLTLQNIVRNWDNRYTYLEVGSHLGGTLLPHLVDAHCRDVISLDPRPGSQRDERGRSFDYEENSTQRMISMLERFVPKGKMLKLRTHDIDASQIAATGDPIRATFAFIDGEHTNQAAFRDFFSVLPYMVRDAIITFHDSNFIFDALANIQTYLTHSGRRFSTFYLPTNVFAVALDGLVDAAEKGLRPIALDQDNFIMMARICLYRDIVANAAHR